MLTFESIESDFAVTLETFMSDAEKRGVRQKHRANLASFILLQLSRTSEFRCFLHEIHTKWFEVMGQRLLDQKEGKGWYRVRVNYDEDKWP